MASSKLADLTATTTPASTDIVYVVVDPSGTPLDRKSTIGNLVNGLFPAAVTAAATTTDVLTIKVTGDTQQRLIVNGNGSIEWGSGSAATDVTVSRSANNQLQINTGGQLCTFDLGSLVLAGDLTVRGNTFGNTSVTLADAYNIILNTSTGSKIGTATNQKLGFHNSTPVVQRAGAAQAAVGTTAATNVTPFGYTTAAQADAIVTLVNEIRAALVEKGLIKGAA